MSIILPFESTHPVVAPDAFVAETAVLIGDVVLGPESSVWYGAVLRGDVMYIRVGARSSIQDNSVVHVASRGLPTLVGDDCTVGHSVVLHACTIGNHVLVGTGSVLLDGVVVGDRTIVGAGSLVTPGTQIPSGVLALGRPARVVRDLRPDELAHLEESAARYVRLGARYREARL